MFNTYLLEAKDKDNAPKPLQTAEYSVEEIKSFMNKETLNPTDKFAVFLTRNMAMISIVGIVSAGGVPFFMPLTFTVSAITAYIMETIEDALKIGPSEAQKRTEYICIELERNKKNALKYVNHQDKAVSKRAKKCIDAINKLEDKANETYRKGYKESANIFSEIKLI